jgi:hypothetical protein
LHEGDALISSAPPWTFAGADGILIPEISQKTRAIVAPGKPEGWQ